jgi:hypothetical protein
MQSSETIQVILFHWIRPWNQTLRVNQKMQNLMGKQDLPFVKAALYYGGGSTFMCRISHFPTVEFTFFIFHSKWLRCNNPNNQMEHSHSTRKKISARGNCASHIWWRARASETIVGGGGPHGGGDRFLSVLLLCLFNAINTNVPST